MLHPVLHGVPSVAVVLLPTAIVTPGEHLVRHIFKNVCTAV